jgi:PTS system nitrogen regulatory IIA component
LDIDAFLTELARQGYLVDVDFESIDGQPTHLFFLLVVPEHSGGQHLKALARISRFFRDAAFRKHLLEAEQLDDVFRAIEEEDAKF